MKNTFIALLWALPAFISCQKLFLPDERGEITFGFEGSEYIATKASSLSEIPDTNNFILNITDAKNACIYSGRYGDVPDPLSVSPGSYTVNVKSCSFTAPKFDTPQYGDEQTVLVNSGGTVKVNLSCRMTNCGVRLNIDSNFLSSYPAGVLFLKSDAGKLMYSYTEKRTAYFAPGSISLVMDNAGKSETLMTRNLGSQEILTVNVTAPSVSAPQAGGLRISVDTTRIWKSENYTIGEGSGHSAGPSEAMSVTEAKGNIGRKAVWVYGYIAGGDLSLSGMSFKAPFSSNTNLAIASRSSVSSKDACLSVSIPAGKIRDAINLHDHPELLGRKLFLKGDIVDAYFKIPGIKNVTDYRLE